MKIILAVDGSSCSDAAIDEVARRVWPDATRIHVVSAVDPGVLPPYDIWGISASFYSQIVSAAQERAELVIGRAVELLQAAQDGRIVLSSELLEGSPKHAIIEAAKALEADLIVVGSHGYGAVSRMVLGSVSHSVIAHAPCSVLVVKEREANP